MSGFCGSQCLKERLNEKRVENWKEKKMYGQFIRGMPEGTKKIHGSG